MFSMQPLGAGFGTDVDAAMLTNYIAQIQAAAGNLDNQIEVATAILLALPPAQRDAVSRRLVEADIDPAIMLAADENVAAIVAAAAAGDTKRKREKKRNTIIGVVVGVTLLGGLGIFLARRYG